MEFLAEDENKRVRALLRENEADITCPICLEDLPAIYSDKGSQKIG